MSSVYTVIGRDFEGDDILSIFTTLTAAEQYLADYKTFKGPDSGPDMWVAYNSYYIQEIELNARPFAWLKLAFQQVPA